ncbi:MAG: hypothetical protein AAF715_25940 [Myxococcota bacterium]
MTLNKAWPLHDTRRGIEPLERACDGGYAKACSSLGTFYEEQNRHADAQKVRDRAQIILSRACQQGPAPHGRDDPRTDALVGMETQRHEAPYVLALLRP